MQSQSRLAPIVGKAGIAAGRSGGRQEQEVSTVEMDTTLARTLGLVEGQKVCMETCYNMSLVDLSQ